MARRGASRNPEGYDPHYHFRLAIDAYRPGAARHAEAGADSFAGQIPTIMKVNSANSLARDKAAPVQAITGSVQEALRLGCAAIGFTIYPGLTAPMT